MSESTYTGIGTEDRPLVWLHCQVRSPPFSGGARRKAGVLLRMIQDGLPVGMPQSRPMPAIGSGCHELRIQDDTTSWRIVYRADPRAVIIVEVFKKKTRATPSSVIALCRNRLRDYDHEHG